MATPRVPTGISPRVDCVFRAVLGDAARTDILLDFLNAVLQRAVPLVAVKIENPVHVPDFIGDDHTVVDVKATDAAGETFQVEMQSWNHRALKERMLYAWADLYEGQLVAGSGYDSLRPVVAIWLIDQNTFRGTTEFHHRFSVCDPRDGLTLTPHLEIHVLELERWRRSAQIAVSPPLLRWMRFFSEAERWVDVPEEIDHPALEAAMSVLQEFQTNRQWNDAYRSRLDALRVQITMESSRKQAFEELGQALVAKEQALVAKAEALVAKEQAEAAKEQAEAAKEQAEAAKEQAEAAKEQAEAAKEQAEAAKEQAEAAKEQAEAELIVLRRRLIAAGFDPAA